MSNLTRWQRPESTVWPSFGRLFGLRSELDRLFEASLSDVANGSSQLLGVWNPAVDLYDNKDNIVVRAELPGMKKEEIEISLHDGTLSISGERKVEKEYEKAETYRSERFVGRFQRAITLPSPVNGAAVTAQYKEGVLTVTLPKTEDSKPKQIHVNVG